MKEKEEYSCDSTGGEVDTTSSRRSSETDEALLLEAEIAASLTDEDVSTLHDLYCIHVGFVEMD